MTRIGALLWRRLILCCYIVLVVSFMAYGLADHRTLDILMAGGWLFLFIFHLKALPKDGGENHAGHQG